MSPIKGLSEARWLPRLGKIHLGVKKRSTATGGEYPSAVDYFVCPPVVKAVYRDEPRELNIIIPIEDDEQWCSQYYRYYSRSRGLVCKGDGERAMRLVDAKTGELVDRETAETVRKEVPCSGRGCHEYCAGRCREVMMLQFLLPEVPGLGIWQIDTSSINSMININSATALIREIYGRISMIPLVLTIEPTEVQAEGKRKTVWVLNFRTRGTLAELMRAAQAPIAGLLQMPVADDEPPEQIVEGEEEPPAPAPGETQPGGDEAPPDYLGAWTEIVALIKELDPTEAKIREWWQKAYQLEVTKQDFTRYPKNPPQKFSGAMIIAFRDELKETKEAQLEQARQEPLQL